ncbi:MAG: ABC transporter permease [Oscillospiraceae bacterium]|nr:ABC transporter permease [Oscillospiraceae bacterium]
MFLHNLKYEFLQNIRAKSLILWLILFPIILGTFFKVAFSGIYETTTKFAAVPIAIVEQGSTENFRSVMDSLSEGDDALFTAEYTDEENALKLLEEKKITGILYAVDEQVSITVASDERGMSSESIRQTIIKTFVEQFNANRSIIVDTVAHSPDKLGDVVSALSTDLKCNENVPLTNGNPDDMLSYFYNLIAMVALLGSDLGLTIAVSSQGNLSAIGARKCCSPTRKIVSIITSMMGCIAVQTVCIIFSISFLAFVLQVDFGNKLPMVYIAGAAGGILGVSLGFAIGSVSKLGLNAKSAISTAFTLVCCFFSGLMVGNMKAVVSTYAPWFNEINPAAVISDSLYCLNFYDDYTRFTQKIVTMLFMSVVFMLIGFFLTRRRKYASL